MKKTVKINLLESVKTACIKRQITMTDVAERIGIARNTLYISLRADIRISTLQRIADAIGCNITEFFTLHDNESNSSDNPTGISTATAAICPSCGAKLHIKIEQY